MTPWTAYQPEDSGFGDNRAHPEDWVVTVEATVVGVRAGHHRPASRRGAVLFRQARRLETPFTLPVWLDP